MPEENTNRLARPVDPSRDHVLGPRDADITLVEYGSYACPHCRTANETISGLRDQLGDRMRYVFRHRPLTGNQLARSAAELAEYAHELGQFWETHITLMTRSAALTEDDLRVVADELGVGSEASARRLEVATRARERVQDDESSARNSGVNFTPTFFINRRRYDGPWDEGSLADAMLGALGHKVRVAALDFASWAPSAGVLLMLASILAVILTNSPWGAAFTALWERSLGVTWGDAGFGLTTLHWINDGLLTVFFLVVGLEIKREFTVGHLASRRSAALPIAAAVGGMVIPAVIYSLLVPRGPWTHGWGIPMATDTAFAVALIIMMGRRVPVELRIFLTAAAIVDDIGSIIVVAVFYSGTLHWLFLGAAAAVVGAIAGLNQIRVYHVAPYLVAGVVLWFCLHEGGLHATLTGVLLALLIPTRRPPNLNALMTQASAIIDSEAQHSHEVLRHGPSLPALRALDEIHDRLESPADRLLRRVAPRSSYVVLPLFALANAGVVVSATVLEGNVPLIAGIVGGLVIGKPLGLVIASMLAVRAGIATKPPEYSWRQLAGAGALAGIGFTMSLFIAAQALPVPSEFAAAKIAIFAASLLAAVVGVGTLWTAQAES